jgi:hypothetical protein
MSKFKIDDKVRCKEHDTEFIIKSFKKRGDIYCYYDTDHTNQCHECHNNHTGGFWGVPEESLELASKSKSKKEGNMKKFMVYGTGCDNKAMCETMENAKIVAKEKIYDSDWDGDIYIYKCEPIAIVEKSIKVKKIKGVK